MISCCVSPATSRRQNRLTYDYSACDDLHASIIYCVVLYEHKNCRSSTSKGAITKQQPPITSTPPYFLGRCNINLAPDHLNGIDYHASHESLSPQLTTRLQIWPGQDDFLLSPPSTTATTGPHHSGLRWPSITSRGTTTKALTFHDMYLTIWHDAATRVVLTLLQCLLSPPSANTITGYFTRDQSVFEYLNVSDLQGVTHLWHIYIIRLIAEYLQTN